MPTPNENRAAGLRAQRQGAGREAEAVDVRQQRPAGKLSAVGSGNVEIAPGSGNEQGTRAARSARQFGDVMRRFGGAAGGSSAA
jgi:hypothetical protein